MGFTKITPPVDYVTFCQIIRKPNETFVNKKFPKYKSQMCDILGKDIFTALSGNTQMKELMIRATKDCTLKTSGIRYMAQNPLYLNATDEEKPYILLFKMIPFWYSKDLGEGYLGKRNYLFKQLNIPVDIFLKLETYEEFRKKTVLMTLSAIEHLSDEIKKAPILSFSEIKKLIFENV